ncbi:MAG: cytochrome c peroxidase [Phycisphaerales bacterium]
MRIHPNQRFVAAVSVATLGVLGATLLVAAGTGDSGEPNGNPVELAAVPLGRSPLPIPASNPQTAAKIELGRRLYFDTRLSADGTVSCATCHSPTLGWADGRPTSKGIDGQIGGRNAPSIINAAYHRTQFWDGRAASLEEQALGPIENPIEMGSDLTEVVNRLSEDSVYTKRFEEVFGTQVTRDGIGKAIAAFERTIISGNSPYDRYEAGDESALNEAQKRGMEIFMDRANCAVCHTPPTFSNGRFYNAGVGMKEDEPDSGRMAVTKRERDFGRFRVPSLREVKETGPYFHDGSAATLEEAVALMAGGGIDNPNLSSMFKVVGLANLTEQDKSDLVEFLKALSGEYPIVDAPELPRNEAASEVAQEKP